VALFQFISKNLDVLDALA